MKYTEKRATTLRVDWNGLTVLDRVTNLLKELIQKVFKALADAFRNVANALERAIPSYSIGGLA